MPNSEQGIAIPVANKDLEAAVKFFENLQQQYDLADFNLRIDSTRQWRLAWKTPDMTVPEHDSGPVGKVLNTLAEKLRAKQLVVAGASTNKSHMGATEAGVIHETGPPGK